MKALLCEAYGPPETLTLREMPMPEPGVGEVRIRVAAAGVNFPDGLIIQNRYQVKPPLPFSPGSEVAGVIDALGQGVEGFELGDRVAAMTVFGAFAQFVIVKAERLLVLPDSMAFDIAASFSMAYGTAAHAFRQRAQLRPGETVLVLGAGGGVGLAAVDLATAMGARVIAAASSPEKLDIARSRGAEHVVDYAREDIRERIKSLTAGRGVDIVYDPVGGALVEPVFRSIARNGRYLVIGFAAGDIPALPLNLPLLKSASIVGVFWGAFTVADPEEHQANMGALFALYADGRLDPLISRHFPLSEGASAIRWVMERKALGKVVLNIT